VSWISPFTGQLESGRGDTELLAQFTVESQEAEREGSKALLFSTKLAKERNVSREFLPLGIHWDQPAVFGFPATYPPFALNVRI
jgi:hypothetical protein